MPEEIVNFVFFHYRWQDDENRTVTSVMNISRRLKPEAGEMQEKVIQSLIHHDPHAMSWSTMIFNLDACVN